MKTYGNTLSWPLLGALLLAVALLAACVPVSAPATTGIANPASENCVKQGGTLQIEERGDGGQFGVCYFEDNLQCEEWALFRGECPAGGVKVTGYATPAGRYCALTGGTYAVTGSSGAADEQGTCTLPNGATCDAWAYYNGTCDATTAAGGTTAEAGAPAGAPAGDWQTYTNAAAGYTIEVPPTWNESKLPDQNDGAIHGMAYSGSEGGVEVYWGVGFGGACPSGTVPVQVAGEELPACYVKNDDGTESWSQIGYQVSGGNSFSVRAYTSNAEPTSHDLVLQVLATLTFLAPTQSAADVTETQVIVYAPGPPTGDPQEGSCWTSSLAVWREDAWRCMVGNDIYDPCFSSGDSVTCGASPVPPTDGFPLTLTEPLPAPQVPPDAASHAWMVELPDGVGDERINYFCPSSDPAQSVVILGDPVPGTVWTAHWAVLTGSMPDLTVVESADVPLVTVWQ